MKLFPISTRVFAILIIGMGILSCNRRPGGVLSEGKMVDLVADMQLAEAYVTTNPRAPGHRSNRSEIAEGVLAAHGVSHEELDSTWGWYGKNLDDYSKLLLKVDKRLDEKRRKLLQPVAGFAQDLESGMLWPFSQNGQISSLGTTDGWILSISNPDLQSGDRLIWKMHINEMRPMAGLLGVEYTDGSSSAVSSGFNGKNDIELSLPTDTGKIVRRIYGNIRVKEEIGRTLYADSITLRALPFDSLEYAKSYMIKRYGPASRKIIKDAELADSINDHPADLPEIPTPENLPPTDKSENKGVNSPSKSAPLKMIQFPAEELPAKKRPAKLQRPMSRPGK